MKRLLAVVALALAAPLWAQPQDEDRPGRGVARISLINGDVSVRRGDSGDIVAAAVNGPLVVEDRVLTGPGSRAEIQFDWSNMLRMAGDAEIRLSELEYRRYQIQLAQGLVTFRVLRDIDADVEISTPSVSVRPTRKGEYRIHVRPDGTTEITVRSGEAEIFTPQGSERLRSGRALLARGSYSNPEVQTVAAARDDDWDRWNGRRDRDLNRSNAYRYVSRDIYGAEDLDAHGVWINDPVYGYVWAPHVAAGWAPYRYGRWSWIDWYGWTWVSYDPWGWAPYHYGRWFWGGGRWCWWPGGIGARHYWRPGLVAFVGWNSWGGFNAGVGFGFGRVGWIPLAPYEPFYPWYGNRFYGGFRNRTYIDNSVNIVNNVNITNVYRNSRVTNAITGVDSPGFGRGGRYASIGGDDIRRASVVRGQMPLVPERDSLRFADREPGIVRTASRDDQRFYSRRPAAAVERVPFDDQRRGMEQVSRRAFGNESRVARGDEGGAVRGGENRAARGGEAAAPGDRNGDGFRRTGESLRAPSGDRSDTSAGWRRFGEPGRAVTGNPGGVSERARESNDGWRRSGESQTRDAENGWRRMGDRTSERQNGGEFRRSAPDASRDSRESSAGWRRFGEPGASSREDSPGMRQRASEDRGSGYRRLGEGNSQSDGSLRVSPPIVRERGNSGDGFRRGGEAQRSESPRYESPRYERPAREIGSPGMGSPRMERAPRMESPRGGGFEGGGMRRSEGGFGGGGRMSAPPSGGGGGGRSGGGSPGGRMSGGGGSRR